MIGRMWLVGLCVVATVGAGRGEEIPTGPGRFTLADKAVTLDVFTYRPVSFDPKSGRILLVFHGVNRNAEEYRDWAKALADATGAVVAAPRFGKDDFPTAKYQLGNLLKNGRVTPKEEWTWGFIPKVADAVRARIGRAGAPFDLIGHSAGGQFLGRSAAFTNTGANALVAANSGTYVFPTRDMTYPLGFGGLPDEWSGDDALRRYLARPLTIFLGTADTVADANFDASPAAMKQGASRYERGKNVFKMAKSLAAERNWEFRWKLVEADGVGHVAEKMFAHPSARTLFAAPAK